MKTLCMPRLLLFCVLVLPFTVAWAGLDIQRWVTPHGARVYFVENHDLPMLDVSVAFDAGSARDTADTSGLATLTRHVMSLGAGELDEQRIAERMADVGAQLGGYFDADRAGFTLRTLSAAHERDTAASVLALVLSKPSFSAAVVEREKARMIANLQESNTKPEFLGEKAFQAAVFAGHPYGLPEAGEVAALAGVKAGDLVDFHQRHYRPANMLIAVMGDIDRRGAERLAADLSAGLPAGPAPSALPQVPALKTGQQHLLPHHASQSHLFIGQPGMKRDDPDYFPLLVGNYILGGGGFDSRLLKEIRQNRGLAYSAYSYFMPMQERGAFQIGLQTRRDATDQALKVVGDTLRTYLADGPTDEELTQAKANLMGGFPLRLDSNRKILEHLAMMAFYQLSPDWLDAYTRQVAEVSRADVLRALRARLSPDAMVTVVVGGQLEANPTAH